MPVRGCDDALRCFRTLNAKDLLETPSLQLVRGLFELELTLRLCSSFLLQNLHQLHVKLVPFAHDYLLRFRFCHLTATVTRGHHGLSLSLVSWSHDLWCHLQFRSSMRHETALWLFGRSVTRQIAEVLVHLLLGPWRVDRIGWSRFGKLLYGGVSFIFLTRLLWLHSRWSLWIVSSTFGLRWVFHKLVEFFFSNAKLSQSFLLNEWRKKRKLTLRVPLF
jgi:hypothetical protein